MKTLNDLSALKTSVSPICMAAGFFDGIHRGHREILARAVAKAGKLGGEAWVLTFDTHPMKVLNSAEAPQLLTSLPHKLRLFGELGIHGCLLLRFTREFADLKPENFVNLLCVSVPSLREIFVGKNWRFGRSREGDSRLLRALAKERNVAVTVIKPVIWRGAIISSTRIRDSILRGNLRGSAAMLGRSFSILGTVIRGRRIGRGLGFPTANLDPHNEVRPPNGVYAVRACLDTGQYNGVLNIGVRPTFQGGSVDTPALELHLPGMDMNLYGRDIEVFFVRKLRDEKKFESAAKLKSQIRKDIELAMSLCR